VIVEGAGFARVTVVGLGPHTVHFLTSVTQLMSGVVNLHSSQAVLVYVKVTVVRPVEQISTYVAVRCISAAKRSNEANRKRQEWNSLEVMVAVR
jgi:hypothetical protein